jgi:hypothetical protein
LGIFVAELERDEAVSFLCAEVEVSIGLDQHSVETASRGKECGGDDSSQKE